MTAIFVSHAWADKKFVDQFVKDILKAGCGLKSSEFFYSSGAGSGVADGRDLMAEVRKRAAAADLVIALVSPTYQTRPVCVAELGAAWGVAGDDKLFPIMVPGMTRDDLEGVLKTQLIRSISERQTLDSLRDRIANVVQVDTSNADWGETVELWLASVDDYGKGVAALDVATQADLEELEKVKKQLEQARGALKSQQAKLRSVEDKLVRMAEVKTAAEAAAIVVPDDEREQFEALVERVISAERDLDTWVFEAVRWEVVLRTSMPMPDPDEHWNAAGQIERLVSDGWLIEKGENRYGTDGEFNEVRAAKAAIGDLDEFMTSSSEEFVLWFRDFYGKPCDLTKRATWDAIFD